MGILEEQYEQITQNFPSIQLIDGYIHYLKLPLDEIATGVFLEINYKNYPKRPKVLMIKPDGQVFKKLDMMVDSLRKWKNKDAPSMVDLIIEVLLIIKTISSKGIVIKRELMDGILALCKQHHPNEMIGLLRTIKGMVAEFILPPGAITSDDTGVFFPSRIPMDVSIAGTVHSHPSGNCNPSPQDLILFRSKTFNIIIGYPYVYNNMKCFDQLGTEIKFSIVD